MYSTLIATCATILVVCLVLFFWIFQGVKDLAPQTSAGVTLQIEIAKALLQLALIAVIGAVVKFLFDRYSAVQARLLHDADRERQTREAEAALRNSLWRELRDVFAQVETARNLIEGAKSAKTYGEQMRQIMTLRTRLGELRHEIEYSTEVFQRRSEIARHVKGMEGYLALLIAEYGERYQRLEVLQGQYEAEKKRGSPTINMNDELNKCPVLKDFREAHQELSGENRGRFHNDFQVSYFNARQAIIPQLLR